MLSLFVYPCFTPPSIFPLCLQCLHAENFADEKIVAEISNAFLCPRISTNSRMGTPAEHAGFQPPNLLILPLKMSVARMHMKVRQLLTQIDAIPRYIALVPTAPSPLQKSPAMVRTCYPSPHIMLPHPTLRMRRLGMHGEEPSIRLR